MSGIFQSNLREAEMVQLGHFQLSRLLIIALILCLTGCIMGTVVTTKDTVATTKYTISFNEDTGAHGTVPSEIIILKGTSITIPGQGELKKAGYVLEAWNDGSTDYAIGTNFIPTAHTTLTAVWKEHTFISIWETTEEYETITLPLIENGTYEFTVDWGDGSKEEIVQKESTEPISGISHTYAMANEYTIRIRGKIDGWSFQEVSASKENILEIQSWGPLEFGNSSGQFMSCTKLTITAQDAPGLSGTTSLRKAFYYTKYLTEIPRHEKWDVSNVQNMNYMFSGASAFNGDLSKWDVSAVESMAAMFRGAKLFNRDISMWKVSNVISMNGMFSEAENFNKNLSVWTKYVEKHPVEHRDIFKFSAIEEKIEYHPVFMMAENSS